MSTATLPARPPPQREVRSLCKAHDLEPLAAQWQRALDACERALRAAAESLPASYLGPRRKALAEERRQTAELLALVAREARACRSGSPQSPYVGSRSLQLRPAA